jgi:Rap1a immunity proteins
MFQLLRGIALIAAVILGYGATFAATDINSANYRMAGCRSFAAQSLKPGTDFERGVCAGKIDTLMTLGPRLGICVPSGATNGQGTLVVVQYIDSRPSRLHESFTALALEALLAAWPCKK